MENACNAMQRNGKFNLRVYFLTWRSWDALWALLGRSWIALGCSWKVCVGGVQSWTPQNDFGVILIIRRSTLGPNCDLFGSPP